SLFPVVLQFYVLASLFFSSLPPTMLYLLSLHDALPILKNSVVSVVNLKRKSSSSTSDPFGIFGSDSSSSSKKNSKSDLETYSEGSGVIYMKSNVKGYIVTNNHVFSGSDEIKVILSDGKKASARKV